jgi:8-oxo-dGTP pyrophosphatase MutT (NUDIX family)
VTNTRLLAPGEAVAALMVLPNGDYLLQHRDDCPDIFFPGFWANFGGALDEGETPEQALRREILEELQFEIKAADFFCTLAMDFRFCGLGCISRHFYEVLIDRDDISRMRQLEGQGMGSFSAGSILAMPKVAPYDALVIWQHASRREIPKTRYMSSVDCEHGILLYSRLDSAQASQFTKTSLCFRECQRNVLTSIRQ